MREPHKFPAVLTGVMIFLTSEHTSFYQYTVTNPCLLVTVLFGGAGALSYLTFGSKINTVVLVNFDSESKMVQTVRFVTYLFASACSFELPYRSNSCIPWLSFFQFLCNSSLQCGYWKMGYSPAVERPASGSSGTRICSGSSWS